ncbi:MAG: hypothetical protein K0A93_12950 [Desulfuromonadaceae bacterium]|nr:hypothetical protein [Desulfuromonadaceae bacterium]
MTPAHPAAMNRLCTKCLRNCKQPASVLLLACPRYLPLPFKVEQHKFEQLELFGDSTDKDTSHK